MIALTLVFVANEGLAAVSPAEAVPCDRFHTRDGKSACMKLRLDYQACTEYNARLGNDYDCRSSIKWSDAEFEEKRARPVAAKPPAKAERNSLATSDQEAVFRRVVAAMTVVKRALRDPDSVVWEDSLARRDGTVICLQYRARNGFSGYVRERIIFTADGNYDTLQAWRRHCSGVDMKDFSHARYALQ